MDKRYLSVYFPNWSINLIQKHLPIHAMRDGVLLVTRTNNQITVVGTCAKAKGLRIKIGSALTLAKRSLPNAFVTDFNPHSDFKALYRLAVWGHSFSPFNGLDPDLVDLYKRKELAKVDSMHFGFNLDITGTERVHKGERALVQRIIKKIVAARLEARIAITSTLGSAWALSRYAREQISISTPDLLRASLLDLPIESLRIHRGTIEGLRGVGIGTIGKLLELPRKSLAKRYGSHCLLRIDQALGDIPESVTRIPMPNQWAVYREYEYALSDHDKIVEETLELLEQLVKELAIERRRGKYFILLVQGEDLWGEAYRLTREFSILIASHNEKHIRSVLYPVIERLNLPGPVYLLGLTSKETEKIEIVQTDVLIEKGADKVPVEELINQFAAGMGEKNVRKVSFLNSYVPEQSFQYNTLTEKETSTLTCCTIRERPSKLFDRAEEITAIAALPDSPPKQITWKGVELKILKGSGPEKISLPWLECIEEDVISREYFKVEDHTGRWLWIYRNSQTLKWFVHGFWG